MAFQIIKNVPVLILTARDTLDERIKGIQQGADDYLCKPFALAEVVVRLQALIRRRYGQVKPQIEAWPMLTRSCST